MSLYRELAALDRDTHLPSLAASLADHAARLAEVGRRADAAVPWAEDAILRRDLGRRADAVTASEEP